MELDGKISARLPNRVHTTYKSYTTSQLPLAAWGITGATTGTSASFGANSENATDFVAGNAGGRVKIQSGTWNAKPVKIWNGSSWTVKPAKVWNGSAWIETNY